MGSAVSPEPIPNAPFSFFLSQKLHGCPARKAFLFSRKNLFSLPAWRLLAWLPFFSYSASPVDKGAKLAAVDGFPHPETALTSFFVVSHVPVLSALELSPFPAPSIFLRTKTQLLRRSFYLVTELCLQALCLRPFLRQPFS